MSYFTEISDYQTYASKKDNFHFIYNSNSGGGQSFLGGRFLNDKGILSSPTVLNGYVGIFKISLNSEIIHDGFILLNDKKGQYEIKPRGDGSTSMKLGIGDTMVNPSKLISSFFMLPPTCSIKSPNNLDISILTSGNYWLLSMWLKCDMVSDRIVHLIPIDFIFCGGSSKGTLGADRFFRLNVQKRVEDIINISKKTCILSDELARYVKIFANIYLGRTPFEYELCERTTRQIMILLSKDYPDKYSGIEDPLPCLKALIDSSDKKHSIISALTEKPNQLIFYGAPGTGKSYKTNEVVDEFPETIRTTFHPDSDYSTFVGAYKPTNTTEEKYGLDSVGKTVAIGIKEDSSGKVIPIKEKKIEYKFVKQAFLKAYIKAWQLFKNSCADGQGLSPQFLVIEEINRGNCAQIFGDLFQLLDRKNGFSEYPIEADEDIQKALLEGKPEDGLSFGEDGLMLTTEQISYINQQYDKEGQPSQKVAEKIRLGQVLVLPPNFYIWATMNTSDQSLFPIDSAFKRRWDWKYIKIAEGRDSKTGKLLEWKVKFKYNEDDKPYSFECSWWEFIKAINEKIASATSSDDKKLGYFFCKPKEESSTEIDEERFVGKVVFYLWNDVFKDEENAIFKVSDSKGEPSFDAFYKEDETGDTVVDTSALRIFLHNVFGENKELYKETDLSEE